MASALVKRPCAKCDKGGGVTTCDGCQQSFCIKHIIEHRQELATQMDNVGQEHDLFRRDLTQENIVHPLLKQVDEWEQESITKIQVTAEAARADLRQLFDQTKNELKGSTDKMTNEMQSCRELDDYTEIDLSKWTEELKELRKLLETQLTVQIVDDENALSTIHMIKIREQPSHSLSNPVEESAGRNNVYQETLSHTQERFRNFAGRVNLTEDGFLATCLGNYWDGSNVYGARLYSSGTHHIHFRIENKASSNLFFGIKTTSYDMPVQTLTSPYTYGWWEHDHAIESVTGHRFHNDRIIRTGDEVTMTLECDNRQIRFEHHRVNTNTPLPVDLEKCPFPWKIMVTLRSTGDSIRIL